MESGMATIDSKEIRLNNPKGGLRIRSFCQPAEIRKFTFDREFAFHSHYKSLYTSREPLEKAAEHPDANIVLALAEHNFIIGYGVLAYPDPGERWAELGPGIMIEVKAIEVCRCWRSLKIAPAILRMLFAYPQIEDKIVYMVGYQWTWDLNETKKTVQQYRQMLIRLFKAHGFQNYCTNEPNICLKPENLFMCRVGKNITQVVLDRFKWLRFGLSPWAWNLNGR
jgi:acetoin utilization protein AcuA